MSNVKAEPAIRARDQDVEQFPVGARVRTPSGRTGTVIKHKGAESKRDHFMRVTVRLDGGRKRDLVTLQPHLLDECPGGAGKAGKIES